MVIIVWFWYIYMPFSEYVNSKKQLGITPEPLMSCTCRVCESNMELMLYWLAQCTIHAHTHSHRHLSSVRSELEHRVFQCSASLSLRCICPFAQISKSETKSNASRANFRAQMMIGKRHEIIMRGMFRFWNFCYSPLCALFIFHRINANALRRIAQSKWKFSWWFSNVKPRTEKLNRILSIAPVTSVCSALHFSSAIFFPLVSGVVWFRCLFQRFQPSFVSCPCIYLWNAMVGDFMTVIVSICII